MCYNNLNIIALNKNFDKAIGGIFMAKNDSFIPLKKWNRNILKAMTVGMTCFFVFAVVLYLLYDPGVEFDRKLYINQFIIIPTVLQLIVVAIFGLSIVFLENRISDIGMTVILSLCITAFLGVMVEAHNSVPEMSILLIYPIFGATVYNSRKIMIIQSVVSTLAYFLIKSVILPNIRVYVPVNTSRTYMIIFIGLNLGAVTISFLLRKMSTEIAMKSQKEVERLELAAKTDQMTGLLNHSAFYKKLDKKIETAEAETVFSLIVFDIDNFKSVNDRFGHASGDKIIIKASDIIKENIRDCDRAFRYGGEEFAVIVDGADEALAARIADRIIHSFFDRENTEEFDKEKFSLSAGVAQYINGKTSSDLFKAADSALYHAKRSGKNRCVRVTETVSV